MVHPASSRIIFTPDFADVLRPHLVTTTSRTNKQEMLTIRTFMKRWTSVRVKDLMWKKARGVHFCDGLCWAHLIAGEKKVQCFCSSHPIISSFIHLVLIKQLQMQRETTWEWGRIGICSQHLNNTGLNGKGSLIGGFLSTNTDQEYSIWGSKACM